MRNSRASSLHSKVALITGGSQGIGLAIARSLADEGCNLIICGRNRTRLGRVRKELAGKVNIVSLVCDVRDPVSVRRMLRVVTRKFRKLDILVNCAGIAHSLRPVAEISFKEWSDVLATNLTGTFLVTQAALPLMKRGATLVNILSTAARRVFPNLSAYCASKFGVLGFTNTLREELRQPGVRVIAMFPGSTDTPIWDTLWPEAPREKMIRPETVAEVLISALKVSPESTVEDLAIMPTGGPL